MASNLRLMFRPSLLSQRSVSPLFLTRQFSAGNLFHHAILLTILARPLLFHTTKPAKLLPAGPRTSPYSSSIRRATMLTGDVEVIEGTVNDPVKVPEPHKSHGSYHWTFERALSVALVPLIVTPFVTGSSTPVLDALIGSAVIIHSHIGFDAMITDYIPKRRFPKSYLLFTWGLRAATAVVLIGIYEFQVNDVGMFPRLSVW